MGRVPSVGQNLYTLIGGNIVKLQEVPKALKYRGRRESGYAAAGRNGLVDGKNL
jgi:hypothetical protein